MWRSACQDCASAKKELLSGMSRAGNFIAYSHSHTRILFSGTRSLRVGRRRGQQSRNCGVECGHHRDDGKSSKYSQAPPAPLPRVRHRHPPPAAADSKIERADGTHRPQAFPKQDVVVLLPLSLAGKAMTSPAQRGEARPQSLRGISKG